MSCSNTRTGVDVRPKVTNCSLTATIIPATGGAIFHCGVPQVNLQTFWGMYRRLSTTFDVLFV